MIINTIYNQDCLEGLKTLPDNSVDCCVTSPPYFGLRDYGMSEQIGLEATPDAFIARLVDVFREVRRVLKDEGTLWVNIGDSYANDGKWGGSSGGKHVSALHGQSGIGRAKTHTGLKQKDLIGIPWMLAFALRADGWYLRQEIIWHKPNPMPESVTDRCTKAHESIFLLSKSPTYYYNQEAIKEEASNSSGWAKQRENGKGQQHTKPGKVYLDKREECQYGLNTAGNTNTRNKRSVWSIANQPYADAHFATFPEELPALCIKAGCPVGGLVLDPFMGAGTTAIVARKLNRNYVGFELNPAYIKIAENRIYLKLGMFA